MVYPNLSAEITRAGLTVPKFADAVGFSVNTLYPKLKGIREFKLSEMEDIKNYFSKVAEEKGMQIDTSLEYLFKRDYSAK